MFLFAFAAALSALAPPGDPQPEPPADQAIVVTGQKNMQKAVDDFVRSLTPGDVHGELSRFEHEVCPAVFGLAEPQAQAVEDRIRLVAKSVGIVVASGRCAPNVLLLVTSDKTAFLRELQRHSADDFGLSDRQFHDLEQQPGPAVAWQVQGPEMTADGVDLTEDTTQGVVVNRTVDPSSRITQPVHPQFKASAVVVERKALVGLTTTQLADYTAIRALTGADPARLGNSSAATILHVLEVPIGGEAPVTMTKWDYDFLLGFYNAQRDLRAGAQRSAISRGMATKLQPPPGK
ncbi:MAG TPA: hypothetical protein VFW35_02455 [Sphingomicrobium sp.]|nr:hypothetical protein [Sphingomicrobium sp.]